MLAELREDSKTLAALVREAHGVCEEHEDIATAVQNSRSKLAVRVTVAVRAFRNGKIGGRTGVGMHALWRSCSDVNRIGGRSCCARTWHDVRGTSFGAAMIDNPVDPSAHISET